VSFNLKKLTISLFALSLPVITHALPVDWHGAFGVDSTVVSTVRRIKSKTDNSSLGNGGTQEIGLDAGNEASASWQSYVLKLNPVIIINDAATLKLEFTTGYGNGGYLGDSARTDKSNKLGSSLYYYNQANGQNLNVKKAYVELYSDTATYLVGRHSYQWGLGAIYNEGGDTFDRQSYSRDGITMKVKIGNFHMTPFWSRVDNTSGTAPSTAAGLTSTTVSTEFGSGFLYDNPEKDVAFGGLYGLKSNHANNTFYKSTETLTTIADTDTKILDFYLKKIFNKADVTLEFPLFSGSLGHVADATTNTSYNAKAIILQSNYKHNDNWVYGFDAGQVSGNQGDANTYRATYLNPNYQVANLLFKYNFGAMSDKNQSVYDSYITNARYFKLRSTYNAEKWTFDSAIIYALAMETATAGSKAFNHVTGKFFDANYTQSNALGTEIDMNAKYRWNNEVSISSGLGYLITGDYFAFTNTATPNASKSSLLLQINTAISF
jgi:hypothetical protein